MNEENGCKPHFAHWAIEFQSAYRWWKWIKWCQWAGDEGVVSIQWHTALEFWTLHWCFGEAMGDEAHFFVTLTPGSFGPHIVGVVMSGVARLAAARILYSVDSRKLAAWAIHSVFQILIQKKRRTVFLLIFCGLHIAVRMCVPSLLPADNLAASVRWHPSGRARTRRRTGRCPGPLLRPL